MCKEFNLGSKASVAANPTGAATVVDCDADTGKFVAICLLCLLSLATILLGAYFGFRLSEVIESAAPAGVDPASVPLLMSEEEFDAADTNHDGSLSKKELREHAKVSGENRAVCSPLLLLVLTSTPPRTRKMRRTATCRTWAP